jgi:hypothetical protein
MALLGPRTREVMVLLGPRTREAMVGTLVTHLGRLGPPRSRRVQCRPLGLGPRESRPGLVGPARRGPGLPWTLLREGGEGEGERGEE